MCTHICSSELRSSEMPNAAQISAFEDADDLFFVGVACARTALISSKAVRKTCVPNPGISKTKVAKCMPLFLFMPTRGLHAATSMAMGDLGGRSLGEGDLGGRYGPSLGGRYGPSLGGRYGNKCKAIESVIATLHPKLLSIRRSPMFLYLSTVVGNHGPQLPS